MTIGQLIDYMLENELEKEVCFSDYKIFGKYYLGEYFLVIEYNNSFGRITITKTLWEAHNNLEID
jgi:hypothetical protein